MIPAEVDADLWAAACKAREQYWGRAVYLRGIIEFSNYCTQNCLYCGLRRDNRTLSRYALPEAVILAAAEQIKELGMGTVVLQAGEDYAFPATDLARLISQIKNNLGLAVTLSLGERPERDYALWREHGADRYLLKLETVEQDLYAQLRPGRRLAERLRCLACLRELGYETGSGLIVGLPGEKEDSITRGLDQLAELDLDMVSISPFVPAPGTPLAKAAPCALDTILTVMAQTRLRMPKAHIPVTSALSLHGEPVRRLALNVGNVLMPSLTPEAVRESYAIYAGKNQDGTDPRARAVNIINNLSAVGFTLPDGPGSAWRLQQGD